MKILIYSAKDFEIPYLEKANNDHHTLHYVPERLAADTAMMAIGFDGISIFSADDGSAKVLELLRDFGVKYIALRSAGYDNVNIKAATKLGIRISHTPDYSPNAIAEHAMALLLALNRKLIIANKNVEKYNFSLSNLVGFDLFQKKVGILGVGRIGKVLVKILSGFGCKLIANDIVENKELSKQYGVSYTDLDTLCTESDIIIISVPLTSDTHHLIDASCIALMKKNVMLINIARGAVVKTADIMDALDKNHIGWYGSDVYEHEHGIFFYNHSLHPPKDTMLKKMIAHPKVLLTPHQAFATDEALINIASTTINAFTFWETEQSLPYELTSIKEKV
ncbi:2-hydroxyacid dehydrogenase [Aquimarina intermedia]|uniref:D-lactate dehydrogenase n=1 Tax=Aquimarina intermedia TaxID=350814 RepID=A0A5S5C772_9FLAO|nr:2-hydroxyacid dehydrogenase [Aquimarina intermedia]TYP74246.1 D-lactate dehydrogenase [Aquimarina intermedia]